MSKKTARTIATLATSAALAGAFGAGFTPSLADAAPSRTGWSAVETQSVKGGVQTIELVSPTGVHQRVLRVGANESLIDVSKDARRVLTQDYTTTDPIIRVYDLATHSVQKFSVGGVDQLRFTNPGGTALLGQTTSATSSNGVGDVVRMAFNGRIQTEYTGTSGGGFLPSLDGRYLYAQDARGRITISGNATGTKIRTLAKPSGFVNCAPQRNLTATTFTAICSANNYSSMQMFRYSANGGAPVALTSRLTKRQFGYAGYFPTPAGTFVQEGVGCGVGPLDKVSGTRTTRLALNSKGSLVDVVGSSALLQTNGGCEGGGALLSANLSTGRVITLYKAPAGRVISGLQVVNPTE